MTTHTCIAALYHHYMYLYIYTISTAMSNLLCIVFHIMCHPPCITLNSMTSPPMSVLTNIARIHYWDNVSVFVMSAPRRDLCSLFVCHVNYPTRRNESMCFNNKTTSRLFTPYAGLPWRLTSFPEYIQVYYWRVFLIVAVDTICITSIVFWRKYMCYIIMTSI